MVKNSYANLKDMIDSKEYQNYLIDKLGNDLFINDPDRAERNADAAEEECNGSTHREVIENQRDFFHQLKVYDPEYDEVDDKDFDIDMKTANLIEKEIDEVEEWHIKNGSIDTEIG